MLKITFLPLSFIILNKVFKYFSLTGALKAVAVILKHPIVSEQCFSIDNNK